jgi:hypothetical protein
MNIPKSLRAGSTWTWREDSLVDPYGDAIQSTDSWALTFYIRSNITGNQGITVVGSTYGTGWQFDVAASSTDLTAGDYFWQAVASKGALKYDVGSGSLEVLIDLVYTGQENKIQAKSQVEQDLDTVEAAIRTLLSDGAVKEYSIGGRSLKKYDLADLTALRSQLKYQLNLEKKAELIRNGQGNPHQMLVRFN